MSKSDIESLQAKIVVLGDPRTGKTSLIRALDPYSKNVNQTSTYGEQTSFTVIEIPSNELDVVANVFLKFWEYTNGKREQEVAFPGALFCIITFDMRAPETANAAFNQWMLLKETHMSESFLFIIGTFLDYSTQRRVEISEICKACAQKEAIYIEVSNLDGSNINLLRRLICQRLNQMLKIREEQKHASTLIGRSITSTPTGAIAHESSGGGGGGGGGGAAGHTNTFSEETKTLPPTDLIIDTITPSLLEKNILSHSIGGIYTSTFYATTSENEWIGFERENQNLIHVGKRINNFIEQISHGLQIPPPSSSSLSSSSDDYHINSNHHHHHHQTTLSEPDADEVRHLFDLMGLPLPPTLQIQNSNLSSSSYLQKKATIKMKIRLPDGSQGVLILRSGDNIEQVVYQFLNNYEMKDEGNSLNRLIDIGTAMLRKAEEQENVGGTSGDKEGEEEDVMMTMGGGGGVGSHHSNSNNDERTEITNYSQQSHSTINNKRGQQHQYNGGKKLKKCKARIKLPNNQMLETIVTEGENAMTIAKRLAEEYNLSMGYQHKIWEQLQIALDSLEQRNLSTSSRSKI